MDSGYWMTSMTVLPANHLVFKFWAIRLLLANSISQWTPWKSQRCGNEHLALIIIKISIIESIVYWNSIRNALLGAQLAEMMDNSMGYLILRHSCHLVLGIFPPIKYFQVPTHKFTYDTDKKLKLYICRGCLLTSDRKELFGVTLK